MNFTSEAELKKYVLSKGCYSSEENQRIYCSFYKPASQLFQAVSKICDFSEKKVLDIGSFYGEFLIRFPKESLGVEISDSALNFSKSLGLKTIKCNVENNIPVENKSYDVVFACHILEHLVSPHKLLRESHRILKSQGLAIISVPNMDALSLSKSPGYRFSEHLYAFNVKSLSFLCERAGFKVTNIFHPSMRFNVPKFFLQPVQKTLARYGAFFLIAQKVDSFEYSQKRMDYFFPSWMPINQIADNDSSNNLKE